jgi:2-methylisocitrate lyase-like PEP mutase family enzyme
VNVLIFPGCPSVSELAEAGVRRISLGSALSTAAFGAVVVAARSVLADGVLPADGPRVDGALLQAAFAHG